MSDEMTYPSKAGRRKTGGRRGQSMVELAMISPILMVIVALAVQFAIMGRTALALSQLASTASQYAAFNSSADQTAVTTYVMSVASPSLLTNGGADLSVVLTPAATPRAPGTSLTVTISYKTKSKIVLPNPFLGVKLPASITDTSTAMGEQ